MSKGLPVKGYTAQNDDNVAQVNFNKVIEEIVLRVCDEHFAREDVDARFVAIAKTHFQEGFMALNRAVFQPQRVEGDLRNANVERKLLEVMSK